MKKLKDLVVGEDAYYYMMKDHFLSSVFVGRVAFTQVNEDGTMVLKLNSVRTFSVKEGRLDNVQMTINGNKSIAKS